MSYTTDKKYGRRGGHLIPGPVSGPPPPCDVCGRPLTAGQAARHGVCEPAADDEPGTLL